MSESMQPKRSSFARGSLVLLTLILLGGGYVRTAGLYRGLTEGVIVHPDAPKQVDMLWEYLGGNPVRYRDSWFYDGYPYGLNVVDAVILRGVGAVAVPWRSWSDPSARVPQSLPLGSLYRGALLLRVLYGLLTIGLVYAAARRFGARQGPALLAAALCAAAPLGATVTHAVTGDVGVDLFLALALWSTAAYAGAPQARWLAVSGLACGMAFACKYQGALGLWIAGAGLLLACVFPRLRLSILLRHGVAAASGFLAGVFLLTPALWVDADRAWTDMRTNFVNIRNYNAPDGYSGWPLGQQLAHGLGGNLPVVLGALGWGLVALVLVALVRMARSWWRPRDVSAALKLAAASFPVVALLLSTALKPAVQLFHFSYLVPAMSVGAALALQDVRSTRARLLMILLALVAIGESLRIARQETFLWKRDEILGYARAFSETVFEEPTAPQDLVRTNHVVKTFYTEPARLPVFRNRPEVLRHPDAGRWRDLQQLALPTVAWPTDAHWIFMNGPVFPRNDREFLVPASGPKQPYRAIRERPALDARTMVFTSDPAGWWLERTLVFEREPEPLRVGVRSGRWPTRYDVEIAGQRRHGLLRPHAQEILEFSAPHPALRFDATASTPASFLVTLRARAQLGPAWVTVLASAREHEVYVAFGPDPAPVLPRDSAGGPPLEEALRGLKYLAGAAPLPLSDQPVRLYGDGHPLAAGCYEWAGTVVNTGAVATLALAFRDEYGLPSGVPVARVAVPPGTHEMTWSFAKRFEPYDGDLVLWSEPPGLQVRRWTLRPSPARMAEWPAEIPPPIVAPEIGGLTKFPAEVRFPRMGTLKSVALQARVAPGAPLTYTTIWELDPAIPHQAFHDCVIFLHLKDAQGRKVATLDYPLRQAALAQDRLLFKKWTVPADLAPGAYTLDGGLYNDFTKRRHDLEAAPGQIVKRRVVRLASVTVTR
jgi:hypothetical protein